MDSSHVALVSLQLGVDGFDVYRSDRAMTLGISITNLSKVLRLANADDKVTLRAEEDPTHLTVIFEGAA